MKHGRPDKEDIDWFGTLSGDEWGALGWRRCHAQLVWNAIGCMAFAAHSWNQGACYYLDPLNPGLKEWVEPE